MRCGYYDGLVAFWAKMAEVGFLRPQHLELLIVDDALDGLLERMAAFVPAKPIVADEGERVVSRRFAIPARSGAHHARSSRPIRPRRWAPLSRG